MLYLSSLLALLAVFLLAVLPGYFIVEEIRYRREVKRLQTRPWGVIAALQDRARHDNRLNRVRHKDAERAVPLNMKKAF